MLVYGGGRTSPHLEAVLDEVRDCYIRVISLLSALVDKLIR